MEYFSNLKAKLIYVFRIPDEAHSDCLKIGEATFDDGNITLPPNSSALNKAATARIDQYTKTAGIAYELLHTEIAISVRDGHLAGINDKEVHDVLLRSGIKRKVFDKVNGANEWFCCDLETAKRAITAAKEGRKALNPNEISVNMTPPCLYPNQRDAVEFTKDRFKRIKEVLWNAKMRFGKTITALTLIKEMPELKRVLIFSHRPVVNQSWYKDFQCVFCDNNQYLYGSKTLGESFSSLESQFYKQNKKYFYFASIQDLRGSEVVGGNFDKNNEIFSTDWDLIIIDEAHEGTQTDLGKAVKKELKRSKTKFLHLSGTPFNIQDEFADEDTYTWDYVMEQRAKAQWDLTHPGDHNPYAGLPRMNIYTYDLGRLMNEFADEDIAFNFREFFRTTEDGEFVHKQHVEDFLNLLTKTREGDDVYPFANKRYRDIFRHTLWMVPGVKAAKALAAMLRNHPVFRLFKIVNVAGDGDEEEPNEEALRKVNNAIGPDPDMTCTITLSCGRLTTGVSVKPWTGVLMLSGSHNTAASAYMQTIFRVQTPATINGRVKEDCYVFDFAPDRTLKVLAETAKISTKAGKQTTSDRQQLGEFLNFCPIIAVDGSKMKRFNTEQMLQQLKRVYVERVVQHGFEDGYLYNNYELMRLSDVDIREFDELKGIIGKTKAMGKTNDIIVNNQGLTDEEYAEQEQLEKKNKRQRTPEEQARLEELKKKRKVKEDAISILRGISIRMPLLIYGADITDEDKELTIDNFTSLVDSRSWEEFMPKGVTMQRFNAFKKYYDPDVFTAAAKRIRQMARAADRLPIEERIERIADIFATFRNPDKETVLTPWPVVNMHLSDTLGGYTFYDKQFKTTIEEPRFVDRGAVTADVFSPDTHLLEINSKSGLYPLYLAYNVYRSLLRNELTSPENLAEHQALWDKAVADNIFVICKTLMAKSITRRTLLGFRNGKTNMWAPDDLINKIKNQPELFVKKVHDLVGKNVKINAIVGNPPYQIVNDRTSDAPVYNLFMDVAYQLSEIATFITPARYLFNAGKTPQKWNLERLNDPHFKIVRYTAQSTDFFPNVDIKGGVAVSLRNEKINFGPIIAYTAFPELNSILAKVASKKEGSICSIIFAQNKFNLQELESTFPGILSYIGSGGREKRLTTSIFSIPDVFTEERKSESDIHILGLESNKRTWRWISSKLLEDHPNTYKWKVILPKSNGSGAIGEVLSTPLVGEPLVGVTQSFITFGAFSSENEATAALKYIKTKFCRTLLGILKVTQDNSKETWKYVPNQDFTENSDIDWSKSVAEIDQQLYAKYKLSDKEIAFIESMIKPM